MKIVSNLEEILHLRSKLKISQKIGFVPTMGYLHEGHLSLVKKAKAENDIVIVSIFVNPAQFGPKEDLSRYPSNLQRDIELLTKLGVDIVFTPDAKTMYPTDFKTYVEPIGTLVNEVEGAIRPGHFRGMATVVLKLFNIVQPDNAYFGQKDAQQALVVSQMIRDLNLPIKLHVCPIIREKDGLAMSSRNVYLKPKERQAAAVLHKALVTGQKTFEENIGKDISVVKNVVEHTVSKEPLVKLHYVEIRHPENFVPVKTVKRPALLLLAAKVGSTRLIDNLVL